MEKRTDQPRQGQPRGRGGREPSDRWDFTSVPPPEREIPQLKEIPETPEERRRRRIILTISAIVAAIAAVAAVLIFLSIRHASRVSSAVEAYGASGRAADLDHALDLLERDDAPKDRALRAWLLANAARELGRPGAAKQAEQLLGGLGNPVPPAAGIARTYLDLAAGRPRDAEQQASSIVARGRFRAEGAHAQALASEAVGALPQAVALAASSVQDEPDAPRYVATLALLLAKTGKASKGLARLKQLEEDAAKSPAARLAAARIALRRGDLGRAAAAARDVAKAEQASGPEHAWARVVLGCVAVARGDAAAGLKQAAAAAGKGPPGSEDFTLWRGRLLLQAGAAKEAGDVLARLPQGVTSSPVLRAHVVAELALARGGAKAAAAALAGAPADGRTLLLRGRVAEVQRDRAAATTLYREAAKDTATAADSLAALSHLALAEGKSADAVEAASKALSADPANAAAVTAFVQAKLAAGDRAGATAAVGKALARRSGDGRLLAAQASVQLAAQDWSAARGTLAKATALQPRDADLFAELGEALRRLRKTSDAKKAYARALKLSPSNALALTGMLQIDVAAEDLAAAKKVLGRIDRAGIESLDVDHARARYYVLSASGQDGISDVRHAIIRRGVHDGELWMALADLQMQAGEPRNAVSSYARVLREKGDQDVAAQLGKALAQLAMRAKAGAEHTLDDIDEAMKSAPVSKELQAQYWAAKAKDALLEDNQGGALAYARKALSIDPNSAEANLALADVDDAREHSPVAPLRAALEAHIPPPEAKGRLAIALDETDPQRCELAKAYRDVAPRGPYIDKVRRVLRDCR